MGENTLGRLFASLIEEDVLPADMTPYSFRYTRGTYSEVMFGNTLVVQRMLNHQTDWGKGQKLNGSALRATPGYVVTLTNTVRPLVNKYATTIKQLCGIEPMSAETKKVFLDGEMLTIYQRHEMAVEAGRTMFLSEAG
jgi:hypothetical protein